jgi:peptidoglycan/xylan/chitin deacetylase (PgdA/CDA1 family)
MSSHLRVHWDRVFVLLAAVTVLLVLLGHAIFRAADTGHAGSTGTEPAQVAAAPVAKPCPPPAPRVLHTMPGAGDPRTVALTFDDGPGPLTDDILEVLARENVKATFFVVGQEAAAKADLVKQMYAAGHAVENHSWSHPSPPRNGWSRRPLQAQIKRTNEAITRITGRQPCYFRPPQGVIKGAEEAARAAGLTLALWSVDTRDWASRGPSAAQRIRSRARAGLSEQHPIVLLHDGGGNRAATLAALPGLIEDYRSHGYEFVTLLDGHA